MKRLIFQRFSTISKSFVDSPSEYIHTIDPTHNFPKLKPFRVIDLEGNLIDEQYGNIPIATLNKIFDTMVTVILRVKFRLTKWIAYSTCLKDKGKFHFI